MKYLTTFAAVIFTCELVSFGVENRHLVCDHPYFAFDVNEIGYSPLDAMYIYDATNAEGRSMRITGGTSAFGAAKVSRIAENQIVSSHFNGVWTFGDYSGMCKTGTLFNAYMPASMATNRLETDVGRRIVKSNLASYGAGTGDVAEKLLADKSHYLFNAIHSSDFWNEMSAELPTIGFVTPETFIQNVPTNSFKNVLPYRDTDYINPILDEGILTDPLLFSSCPNELIYEIGEYLPDIYNEEGFRIGSWADLNRKESSRTLSTNLTSFLATRCRAQSAKDKHQRRFNYEKSCAEAWLISLFDTTFGWGNLALRAPYHHVTFESTTIWPFKDSVKAKLALNEDRSEYRIVMEGNSLNFEPHPLEITSDEIPWYDMHAYVDVFTDVEREVVEVDVTCNGIIYLTKEEILNSIAGYNLPDGQEFLIEMVQDEIVRPLWRIRAISADSEHRILDPSTGLVKGLDDSDDWNVVLRLTVNGDGGYSGSQAELEWSDLTGLGDDWHYEFAPRKFAWDNDMIDNFFMYSVFKVYQQYPEVDNPKYLALDRSGDANTLQGAEQLAAENHEYVLDFVNDLMIKQTGIDLVGGKIVPPFSEGDLIKKIMELGADPPFGMNALAGLTTTKPYRFRFNKQVMDDKTEYSIYCDDVFVKEKDRIPCKIGYGVMLTMPIDTDYVQLNGYDYPFMCTTYKFKSLRMKRN